jgi:hypothetical protein
MPRATCFMDMATEPHYRQALEVYQFLMTMTNALDRSGTFVKLPINSFAVGKRPIGIGGGGGGR